MKWNDENVDPIFSKKAKAFVTWLQEASEDSTDDEDDDEDEE